MKLREAINALKMMRDVRIEDELLYLWISELEGRVQTEIMLWDVLDIKQYTEEQYDAAQYLGAEFERKYKKYAAWYINQYRPAKNRRE